MAELGLIGLKLKPCRFCGTNSIASLAMNLPTPLISQVREGRVVLLLGSGASFGSQTADGNPAPSADELAKQISQRFLSNKQSAQNLASIAELAISETSLVQVQRFISETLRGLQPTQAHKLLPTFRWHGLATTNYDRLIEVAFQEAAPKELQSLIPIMRDSDNMNTALQIPDNLPLLKLHGCISQYADHSLPFVLTPDQYVTHRKHRANLFKTFKEWASEHTLVAIGQSLNDFDLRQLLLELAEFGASRPRYYLVGPDVSDEQHRLWESKRITTLNGTFAEFVTALNEAIPPFSRRIVVTTHPDPSNQ